MMIIEATEEEIIALRQLLHRAVLHSGMEVAEAAAFWNRKLMAVQAQKGNGADKAAGGRPELVR
jgi:hypothetical protein